MEVSVHKAFKFMDKDGSGLIDTEGHTFPIADCATRCLAVDECESFAYGGGGKCYLYSDIAGGVSGLELTCEIAG